MQVYNKKGNLNSKEKKYAKQLQKEVEKLVSENPLFESDYKPANSFEELEAQYNKYVVTDVEHVEVPNTESSLGNTQEEIVSAEVEEYFADPFTKANAKERDYVGKDGFTDNQPKAEAEHRTSFEEPKNANEAFSMPPKEDDENASGSEDSGRFSDGAQKDKKSEKKSEGFNPQFDAMSAGVRNKRTKRMAVSIINGLCYLLSEGVPFLVTMDITPEALAKAAKNKQINLDVILTFDGETQVRITDWFKMMCHQAKDLGQVPEDLKERLIEDLYEVLLEKKITPTPMQGLLMTAGEMVMLIGIKAVAFRAQVKQVKEVGKPEEKQKQPPRPTYSAPPAAEQTKTKAEAKQETKTTNTGETTSSISKALGDNDELQNKSDETFVEKFEKLQVGESLATKE